MDIQNINLGILGGGQLGKMLTLAAHKWDISTHILDPNENCPAAKVSRFYEKGDFTDYDTVYNFGKKVDMLTIEIEKVNLEALFALEKEGLIIYPAPSSLELIRDKGNQRAFMQEKGIPGPAYKLAQDHIEIMDLLKKDKLQYPFVQKIRTGGYDGRGVSIIRNENDLEKLLPGESLLEEMIEIEKEISVLAVRSREGEVFCYDPVEMVFDKEANLLDYLMSPAAIDKEQENKAMDIARQTIEAFDVVGLLAVELFIDKAGNILVNEVAPRPHNSGHHTIEASATSQFEQHLRAVCGLSLGSVHQSRFALMANLLGEPNANGKVHYKGLPECISQPGIHMHIYGKKQVKPYRKMGHVTILAEDLQKAKERLNFVRDNLKVIAYENSKQLSEKTS